jgi:hypothetical protein
MNPNVLSVTPLSDYRLRLVFANGDIRLFDASVYLDFGIFAELRDPSAFAEVYVENGSVEWPGGQGLSFNTLYLDSVSETLAV